MIATGNLDENSTKFEHINGIFAFTCEQTAVFERCLGLWNSFLPSSPLYTHLPDTIDWTSIEEGHLCPRGVPYGKKACVDKYNLIKSKFNTDNLRNSVFEKADLENLLSAIRLGGASFPGLLVKDNEMDVFMKSILKACLMESIHMFAKGKGKVSYLNDILRELKQFLTIRNWIKF